MHAHTTARLSTRSLVATLVAAAALLLAGCGAGSDHNDADVAFATDMIPHHAQALMMVESIGTKPVSAGVTALAADISKAQDPEIETMSGWLTSWEEKVPDTGEAAMSSMNGMEGMMSAKDLTALDRATGPAFERRWLQMMIEHHAGAVTMAKTEIADGQDPAAVKLARSIVTSQSAQIATMKQLLAG